jgi:hypothetical protein
VIVAVTETEEAPLPATAGAVTGAVVTIGCAAVAVFDDDATSGAAVGTAGFEPADGDETPNALVAVTVKVYESPPVRPAKVAEVPDTVCDTVAFVLWSSDVTVYVVTALPETGAVHVTSTSPTFLVEAVAVTLSGVDGAVPVGAAAVTVTDADEDVLGEKFGSPL